MLLRNNQSSGKPTSKRYARLRYGLQRFFIHREFALLWSGRTISSFCSYITAMGLPIAALLLLHATPAQMGILTALTALPGLLLGIFIGVWVDRLPRRLLMIAADLGRALLLASIPLAAVCGALHLALFYLVTILVGIFTVSFEVASLSFLPTLLRPEDLAVGNSRLSTSEALAEIAGPPLAGLLIQLLSVPLAILLDVLSFCFSACCINHIRASENPRAVVEVGTRVSLEIRDALHVLLRDPLLRVMAACAGTQNFFGGFFAALYLIYVLQLFSANPLAYGLLVACGGAGAFAGSLGANWCARRFGTGRTLLGSALMHGLLSFCTPLAAGPGYVIFGIMAFSQLIGDTCFAVYSINNVTLRQQLVPNSLQGRVNACMHVLSNGMMPLGALLAGFISQVIGIRLTLFIGSSGILLAATWLLFSPMRRYS